MPIVANIKELFLDVFQIMNGQGWENWRGGGGGGGGGYLITTHKSTHTISTIPCLFGKAGLSSVSSIINNNIACPPLVGTRQEQVSSYGINCL